VEQWQDQQAVVGPVETEGVDDHAAHRGDVGVVEHDALGAARGATGVDDQREPVRRHGDLRGRGHVAAPVEVRGVQPDRRSGHGVPDHYRRPRVTDLVGDLRRGQRRVHRSDRGAEAPGGEQRHHGVHTIRQNDGHDITGADAVRCQNRGSRPNTIPERGIVERPAIVGQTGPERILPGPFLGEPHNLHCLLRISPMSVQKM
jgi:hypothetical protein